MRKAYICVYGVKRDDYAIFNDHNHWLLVPQSEQFPNDVYGYWMLNKVYGMWRVIRMIPDELSTFKVQNH